MKLIAKNSFSSEIKEVFCAYFDITRILPIIKDELLLKVLIRDNKIKIHISNVVKKILMCYYVDLDKLKLAAIKFILKHRTGLIPPDFKDTSFDEVILRK